MIDDRSIPTRIWAGWRGILQADAYGGYNGLYNPRRKPGPVTSALCWSHARRGFFELADIAASARRGSGKAPISPIALEDVNRIDALFAIRTRHQRHERRGASSHSTAAIQTLVEDLRIWLQEKRAALSARPRRCLPSTTCSSAGTPLPPSLTMGVPASRTMPPRASPAWLCPWQKELALCRIRSRRGPGSSHGDTDRHRETQ